MRQVRTVYRGALALMALWPLGVAEGQERPSTPKGESAVSISRFFDRPIDYWQRGLRFEEETRAPGKETPAEKAPSPPKKTSPPSDWGQIVRQPDGSLATYELPRPLVAVLEEPTPENIRAYLDWKRTRAEKILRAAEAMKEYRARETAGPDPQAHAAPPGEPLREAAPVSAPPRGDPAPQLKPLPKTPFKVIYFHRTGCPHCDSQDIILGRWLKDRPEGKFLVVDFGEKPELWRKYQVRGTPTLVIEAEASQHPVILEGLSQDAELSRALRESASPDMKSELQGGPK